MINNRIRNIIFDLGGVLIDWNPRYLYRKLFRTEAAVEYFLQNITTFPWNEEQDAGRPLHIATQILIDRFPEYSPEIDAYYGKWEEDMLGDAHDNMVQLLREFIENPSYRVYALTNWSAETFPVARRKFPFLSWFEGIVVSGEEKVKKPDPAIYHILLKRFDLITNECLFIDDSVKNVSGAKRVGLHAIHFQNVDQLKNDLIPFGIVQ
ncbi:MAG TPA: HAD family phosphatase [Saprospiraceae bacterium]|nr:HAD family phosphatase [Saprospiraceae bacterium]